MKTPTFSTSVLRIDAFRPTADAKRLTPDEGRNFLVNVYPSLAAALAVGFGAESEESRQSFGCLRIELATLYDAAIAAWSTDTVVKLERDADLDAVGDTLDLARVVACQYLARDLQGGAQELGFDLLADLLVSRLEAQSKDSKSSKAAA